MSPSFAGLAAAVLGALLVLPQTREVQAVDAGAYGKPGRALPVQLGPRPFYLLDRLREGALKKELQRCAARKGRYRASDFSIGHRGAPLLFPEHTAESYVAAARMGAGILECDVTFTKDAELVCRHAQCDLHTTTDIVLRPELAAKCQVPPVLDADGRLLNGPDIKCCTSDLTLAEFKTLKGKMDAADPDATTLEDYVGGTAAFRTDLHTTGGTLLTHAESIALFKSLGTGFTPELKGVDRDVGFGESGLDQISYAREMLLDYLEAGIRPDRVWPQSFNLDDVFLWIQEFPAYGRQAVFLDGRNVGELAESPPSLEAFLELKAAGLNIVAPPMPVLLTVEDGEIVPSDYARNARQAGLDIISWTTERSGRIVEEVLEGRGSAFYYQTTLEALESDGDILRTIDVLAQDVGIIALFSDWPATTTFYANCKKVQAGRPGDDEDDDDE
ncbi:MAG: glycerophosphodiester phosphodiesterase family protein [Kiloniellales bacterium]|nr:glycerophosphodiester phosphodiesterase family protein [Kiloniellales bacterium]